MKIAALCAVYNEAKILPYFLNHYHYCDEIRVLYETDSDDGTKEILQACPNVTIREHHVSGGLDDTIICQRMNAERDTLDADWVYVLSPDELILPPEGECPRAFLERQRPYNTVLAAMFNVYRHRTENDLNPALPPIKQRVHGDPDILNATQTAYRDSNAHFVKPCIVRPRRDLMLLPGYHDIVGPLKLAPEMFIGAHWQMADESIAVSRRMQNRRRMSEANKSKGMGFQHFHVTEEWIADECKAHLDDPEIWQLAK